MLVTLEKTQTDFLHQHGLDREWVSAHFYELYLCIEDKIPVSKRKGEMIALAYQFYTDEQCRLTLELLFSQYPRIKKEIYLTMEQTVTEALALMADRWDQLEGAKTDAYYLLAEYTRISARIIKKEFSSLPQLDDQ